MALRFCLDIQNCGRETVGARAEYTWVAEQPEPVGTPQSANAVRTVIPRPILLSGVDHQFKKPSSYLFGRVGGTLILSFIKHPCRIRWFPLSRISSLKPEPGELFPALLIRSDNFL
jgi:hypothetical protein